MGRERELREIKRELETTRLLTLTGAGGSGKTRLALEVARDLVEAYPDGVWLVQLAPLSEEALVPKAVAQFWEAHGHYGEGRRWLKETLETEHLAGLTSREVEVLRLVAEGLTNP